MSTNKTHITLTGEDEAIQTFTKELNDKITNTKVHLLPTVSFAACNLTSDDILTIHTLSKFDYLFFSSARAVRYFKQLLDSENVPVRDCPPAAVVGPMTAKACEDAGISIIHQPHTYTAEHMIRELSDISHKKILFPRSTIAPEDTITSIQSTGAEVTRLPLYQTVSRSQALTQLEKDGLMQSTYIIFMSPSSIRSFMKVIDETTLQQMQSNSYALCIGPRTQEIAHRSGWQTKIASPHTSVGLIETVSTLTKQEHE